MGKAGICIDSFCAICCSKVVVLHFLGASDQKLQVDCIVFHKKDRGNGFNDVVDGRDVRDV